MPNKQALLKVLPCLLSIPHAPCCESTLVTGTTSKNPSTRRHHNKYLADALVRSFRRPGVLQRRLTAAASATGRRSSVLEQLSSRFSLSNGLARVSQGHSDAFGLLGISGRDVSADAPSAQTQACTPS